MLLLRTKTSSSQFAIYKCCPRHLDFFPNNPRLDTAQSTSPASVVPPATLLALVRPRPDMLLRSKRLAQDHCPTDFLLGRQNLPLLHIYGRALSNKPFNRWTGRISTTPSNRLVHRFLRVSHAFAPSELINL